MNFRETLAISFESSKPILGIRRYRLQLEKCRSQWQEGQHPVMGYSRHVLLFNYETLKRQVYPYYFQICNLQDLQGFILRLDPSLLGPFCVGLSDLVYVHFSLNTELYLVYLCVPTHHRALQQSPRTSSLVVPIAPLKLRMLRK